MLTLAIFREYKMAAAHFPADDKSTAINNMKTYGHQPHLYIRSMKLPMKHSLIHSPQNWAQLYQ
ncbi:MAG: hypothetical protein HZB18_07130 [Chloroflexi bacterium]|nr:hypothetical protein [Chloroflexota bacterium]